jgi:glycine cleavage system transcriptional repressor
MPAAATPSVALVSILAADRVGLVSAIAGRLYDLGINLRDTTFAAMGQGAEFSAVCELPADLDLAELERDLSGLPELEDARVEVSDYEFEATPGPEARITHRIEVSGGDQLGLIARLADVFREYGANIVRLEAQKIPTPGGDRYVTRFAVSIPPARAEICLSAVANTAGSLRLDCDAEEV